MQIFNLINDQNLVMTPVVSVERAKVLIIDGNPFSRMTARDLLSLDGYEILEAEDGLQITAEILEQKPDLILLDVRSGLEACQKLKSDEQTRLDPRDFNYSR